ncbi:NUDIX hydrolase [Clostridium mediterraneense]|uniref:NUDIX hydrolase n=1 Tax=Clostridium mediterraneense TaxID=1805472 RepID=UPI00082AB289|nr:NUDIX hydrolase [Clostridium mediterraneense]
MELIKEITNNDIGLETNKKDKNYRIRRAARAIVINDKDEVAILKVSNLNYHKLPGGGIEENETIKEATYREIKEETGCDINILDEVGMIIEYADNDDFLQISYCYLTKAFAYGQISLTEGEIAEGIALEWMPIDKALKVFKEDKLETYSGKFINLRDLMLLEKAYEIYYLNK